MTLMMLIELVAYGAFWIFSGYLLSLYFKGFMCLEWKHCAPCKKYERRWYVLAWVMDIAYFIIAIPFVALVLHHRL